MRSIFILCLCSTILGSALGDLIGRYPAGGGYVSLSPTGDAVDLSQVEFVVTQGGPLEFGGRAYPFAYTYDSRDRDSFTFGFVSPNEPVNLAGTLVLDLEAPPGAEISGNVWNRRLARQQPFDVVSTDQSGFQLQGRLGANREIVVERHPNSDPVLLRSFAIRGQDLTGGLNPAPFSEVVVNSPSRWHVASSSDVFVDGALTLDVTAAAVGPLTASVSNGTDSAHFTIRGHTPVPVDQQIIGTFPLGGGPISLQATALTSIRQLQILADGGFLAGGDSPAPFDRLTTNTSGQWVAESNEDVKIFGRLRLDVAAGPNSSLRGFAQDAAGTTTPFPLYGMSPTSAEAEFVGLFPTDGGRITVYPTNPGNPPNTGGFNFKAEGNSLSTGASPLPFDLFVSGGGNRENQSQATVGSIGRTVVLSGPTTFDITVAADAILTAEWGDGITPVEFPVFGGRFMTGLLREQDKLSGSYPMNGGPISIRSLAEPVLLRHLRLDATSGGLQPGDDPAPFEIIEIANAKEWEVASAANVMIDGEVTLDVEANAFSLIKGVATSSGNRQLPFALNGFTEFVHDSDVVAVFPEEGGPLTIFATEEGVSTSRIEFSSENATLMLGTDPTPFDQFVVDPNDPNKLALVSFDGPVIIDEPMTLDIQVPQNARFFGTWGVGVATTFPAIAVTSVPEPQWGTACLSALLLLMVRRRRR